jgi:hypothetical protein
MTISMYQSSVPVFIRNLTNLSAILTKAATYAEVKKIEQNVLLNARLFPDMLPLLRQIQIACDTVKTGTARLAEVEIPSNENDETTFAELQERISSTISFLQTVKAEQIDGKEDFKINYTQRNKERSFIGQPYLLEYTLPNLYFHVTAAYAILRHNGVEIGKKDYLGTL